MLDGLGGIWFALNWIKPYVKFRLTKRGKRTVFHPGNRLSFRPLSARFVAMAGEYPENIGLTFLFSFRPSLPEISRLM
jgi:hypothetical protein